MWELPCTVVSPTPDDERAPITFVVTDAHGRPYLAANALDDEQALEPIEEHHLSLPVAVTVHGHQVD